MSEYVTRGQWKNEPLVDSVPIPAPERLWTDDEMSRIRVGLLPVSMDDKWFMFMEHDLLHLHRSWTGHGIYEAQFVRDDDGYRITLAVVTSDGERYRRSSDATESALLERLIASLLLDEPDTSPWPVDDRHGPKLSMVMGDITTEQVDAIVNAANSSLLGGGGLDGAIHRAAGPELVQHCRNLGGCKTGEAKITPGFNLDAQWIIHTVGPVWRGGINGEADLLASCYRESLARADEVEAKRVAFPAIATGIFGYPIEAAARIAVATVTTTDTKVSEVRFVVFDQDTWDAYDPILREQLGQS